MDSFITNDKKVHDNVTTLLKGDIDINIQNKVNFNNFVVIQILITTYECLYKLLCIIYFCRMVIQHLCMQL